MKTLLNKLIIPTFILTIAITSLVSCKNNDRRGGTEATLPTVEDVEAAIIGQWTSNEMTLTFMPNNVVNINHGEIIRESLKESISVAPRDDNEQFAIRQGKKRVEILIGRDDYDGYEYMYVRTINSKTLAIEFYGNGITFKLNKTGNFTLCPSCDGTGEQTCHACDGAGGESIILGCGSCSGNGYEECYYCWGSGERYSSYYDEYITCDYCDGSGSETCHSCWGSGSWGSDWGNCDYCWGTGTKGNCYDCNGDGYNITPIK